MFTVYSAFISQSTFHSVCYWMRWTIWGNKTFQNTWELCQMVDPPISDSLNSDASSNINGHSSISFSVCWSVISWRVPWPTLLWTEQVLQPARCWNRLYNPQRSSCLNHNNSDCTRMIGTLCFLALLSSAMAWGVRMAWLRSADSSLFFEALPAFEVSWSTVCSCHPFFSQRVGLWSQRRNETGGGSGDRCTCDAFLPSSTFPINDLVVVEQTAGEISHKLELEMGKVLRHIRSIIYNRRYETYLRQTKKCVKFLYFSWKSMRPSWRRMQKR